MSEETEAPAPKLLDFQPASDAATEEALAVVIASAEAMAETGAAAVVLAYSTGRGELATLFRFGPILSQLALSGALDAAIKEQFVGTLGEPTGLDGGGDDDE